MSIIRNGPGTDTGAVRQQEGERGSRAPKRADAQSVDAFRQAMEQQRAGQDASAPRGQADAQPRDAATFQQAGQDPRDHGRGSSDALPPPESAALWQAQQMATQAPALATHAPPAAANPAAALAKMLERHVRQLAVSEGGTLNGDGQILLRLDEATLPGTDLMLTRTADGWVLQADVRSAESFQAIRDAAGQLGERFAERGLGQLVVEPRYHG